MTQTKAEGTLAVIPARLASTRLPRKVLREIAGKPMLQWVVEAARACPQLDEVVVATDAVEVAELCRTHGWPVVMTSSSLASGSDRVNAVAQMEAYSGRAIYVNIQADEPLLRAEHLVALLQPFAHAEVDVTTLKVRCAPGDLVNPNTVKVVTDRNGRALYFSRATIPYDRDGAGVPVWKHLGLYAYRSAALERFHALPPSTLETAEKLEQLRMLENGMAVYVAESPADTVGVDTEDDLKRVEKILLEYSIR
jgi:3-deoxy-manno-octulosonate cytidylyltransferase (CMP-KDO synthetase)